MDIAGLVKGASQGAGLGNKFLGNIRECDAIIHVIRCFDDDNVVREGGAPVNPVQDKEIIDTEMQLKDLDTIEAQLAVQKGKWAACALALDRQLNSVDFPTLGRPTIPHFNDIFYYKRLFPEYKGSANRRDYKINLFIFNLEVPPTFTA